MWEQFDIWQFVAGLGIFLFGMSQMEIALRKLAGRSFRGILERNTNNRLKAIFSGTVITAILQSSSVVSLITLALVGAGLMQLSSALGIIIGSNLGTTFTGWIVASLGFKISIESFALPLIGTGSLILILLDKYKKPANIGRLFAGFGFLFMGLDFMKESIEYLSTHFDLTPFVEYPLIVFLLVGFVFTALIQSSSATMVITLSALNSGLIPFHAAAALVIGADLGTTITALIGGLPGIAIKKRVALGHFLFNLVTDLIAFILLVPLTFFITDILGISDQLFALVAFHSVFNLIGILIFAPMIGQFAKFLSGRFVTTSTSRAQFVLNVDPSVTSAAIQALEKDALILLDDLLKLQDMAFRQYHSRFWTEGHEFLDQYTCLKQMEGELFVFYNQLQQQPLQPVESARLNQLILVIRHALHSAKSIKDIESNLREIEISTSESIQIIYQKFRQFSLDILERMENILESDEAELDMLLQVAGAIQKNYDEILLLSSEKRIQQKPPIELSTVLTINREIYSSHKSLIAAIIEFRFSPEIAREFGNIQTLRA